MTHIHVPPGLADAPLAERRRIEVEQHVELRAGLVRRHFDVMDEQFALAGGQLAHDLQMADALANRSRPTPIAPIVPVPVIQPEAPSAKPDYRAQLGLT